MGAKREHAKREQRPQKDIAPSSSSLSLSLLGNKHLPVTLGQLVCFAWKFSTSVEFGRLLGEKFEAGKTLAN